MALIRSVFSDDFRETSTSVSMGALIERISVESDSREAVVSIGDSSDWTQRIPENIPLFWISVGLSSTEEASVTVISQIF